MHTRSDETISVEPKDVIILEGILVLEDERLREMMDIKVFVDTDSDLRIIRRMMRDINERGRSIESVIDQYVNVVRPIHLNLSNQRRDMQTSLFLKVAIITLRLIY